MADYSIPIKNTAYQFYVSLISQADTKLIKDNPTLADGDVKVSINGGAFTNIGTLPSASPASGRALVVSLTAAEMNGDNIVVQFVDAAGAEWCDLMVCINPMAAAYLDAAITTRSSHSAADVWAATSRTLTQTAASVAAAVSGSTLTITRGDTFTASLTGLGNISTRTKLYFTIKASKADTDNQAVVQVEETAGLTRVNGAAYTTVTDGSLVVTDAVTGALTITLKPDVTKSLAGNGLYYDLQTVTAAGVVTTITAATCNVVEDVTRAVS